MTVGSISFVVLALDEEATIAQVIADCRAVAAGHGLDHEVVVVDDGSRDRTRAIAEAEAAAHGDVVVVVHEVNRGMGASMRDGYRAANKQYLAHLPGDRQVRAEAVVPMLALAGPDVIVRSRFANPPSGRRRAVMSLAFRALARVVGGFTVDFAGTYLFHRDWLGRSDARRADSDSFLYSFQLLELFRRAGARFASVRVPTYPREVGVSREATGRRIARMAAELARARLGKGR